MLICNTKKLKSFLSSIFFVFACLSLHAVEQSVQPNAFSNNSSLIYIAEDTKIYGAEHLFVKHNTPQTPAKNVTKTESKKTEPVKNNASDKKEPSVVVVPDFPFTPSSSSYLNINNESAVAVLQQKLCEYQPAYKANQRNTYPDSRTSDLSVNLPKQRQKLSIAAIQCGILTTFSPNSPSLWPLFP